MRRGASATDGDPEGIMKTRQRIEYRLVREAAPVEYDRQMTTPEDVCRLCADVQDAEREKLLVLLLDNCHRVIAFDVASVGGQGSALLDVGCVMRGVVLTGASAIIMVHNHPSGQCEPSEADHQATRKIKAACGIFDVRLLDHIIIGEGRYWSSKEAGLLEA